MVMMKEAAGPRLTGLPGVRSDLQTNHLLLYMVC
jgi:hypothetical protein